MDAIKFYMTHHTIPGDLQNRVKKWAEYSWNRYCVYDTYCTLVQLLRLVSVALT